MKYIKPYRRRPPGEEVICTVAGAYSELGSTVSLEFRPLDNEEDDDLNIAKSTTHTLLMTIEEWEDVAQRVNKRVEELKARKQARYEAERQAREQRAREKS